MSARGRCSPSSWRTRATSRVRSRSYARARVVPDDAQTCVRARRSYTARAKYDQAESDLKRAVKMADRTPDVHVQLGVLFCKRARWREAIEPLRAAIAADSPHAAAHYHLGDAYNAVDELPAALGAYERPRCSSRATPVR